MSISSDSHYVYYFQNLNKIIKKEMEEIKYKKFNSNSFNLSNLNIFKKI